MKKLTALFVALVILVTAVQPLFTLADTPSENDVISQMFLTSPGAVIDSNASSVKDGEATVKVTLPANGYVQFMQEVSITDDAETTSTINQHTYRRF